MASAKLLFSVVVLLYMLAVTSTADDHHKIIPQPRPWQPEEPTCQPGMAFPAYTLPRCRVYLKRKCISGWVAEPVRQECCQQLAAIQDVRCKCPAIAHMLASLYRELGVKEGQQQPQEEAFPGCRTYMMTQVAARLPIVCMQEVPHSGSVCPWANGQPRQMED